MRNRMLLTCAILFLSLVVTKQSTAAEEWVDPLKETKEQRDARLKWWREARFGMFVHWGLYAVPAGTWNEKQIPGIGEWIMNRGKIPKKDYVKLAENFNPVKFDADQWVNIAKSAGMKYIVITSKHHDGFAMYHSKADKFNIVDATPFDRDPLKELAAACKKHGLKLGFYYSQAQDWTDAGGAGNKWDKEMERSTMEEYIKRKVAPQVREILTEYGDVAILWWDTPRDMTTARADMLRPLIKLQPGIITNNRLGGGYAGDYETPEQRIPAKAMEGRDWETCMTMNGTWGFKSYDHKWKSTEDLTRKLADIVSKGGNFLLNVGPTAEGLIPQPSIDRLREVGQWMEKNGESIYGSGRGPYPPLAWGRVTAKPDKLFIHVFDWPQDSKIILPGLVNKTGKAWLLAESKTKLKAKRVEGDVVINVPSKAIDPVNTVIVLEIEGKPEAISVPIAQLKNGNVLLKAVDADLHGEKIKYESGNGKNNLGFWTNQKDWAGWNIKVASGGTFEVVLEYAIPKNIAGSTFVVSVGKQTLNGTVKSTGDWAKFEKFPLGKIDLEKNKSLEVSIKPTKLTGYAFMNLKAIHLVKQK